MTMSEQLEPVRTCKGCRWWVQVQRFERDGLPIGECRARCPRVFQKHTESGTLVTRWPLTVSLDFCGQFREGTNPVKPVPESVGGAR
jgi:hypothetical protein